MKLLTRILLFLFITFILIECTPSEKVTEKLEISVIKSEINVWLNLMPGTSPGTFNVAGEINIENTGQADIENIKLINISVFTGDRDEEIYSIKPYFKPKNQVIDNSILAGSQKEFTFGTEQGLKILEVVEKNNHVDVQLDFSSDKKIVSYRINDVEVGRAY